MPERLGAIYRLAAAALSLLRRTFLEYFLLDVSDLNTNFNVQSLNLHNDCCKKYLSRPFLFWKNGPLSPFKPYFCTTTYIKWKVWTLTSQKRLKMKPWHFHWTLLKYSVNKLKKCNFHSSLMIKSDQEKINYDLFWFQNMPIFN